MTVILVEIDMVSPAGAAVTARFSDRAIRPFPPTDPDRPNSLWEDRLIQPPSLKRAMFDDVASLTPGLGFGAMELANADRGLDVYQGHAWTAVRVWRWTEGTAFAAAEQVHSGLLGQVGFGTDSQARVSVSLYDYRAELEGQLQPTTYAGTNGVGGVLYEGQPDGLKGQPKPLAWGDLTAAHLPAPQVNAGVLAYQLHNGVVSGSEQIFDRGDSSGFLFAGALVGAAFDAYSPPAAQYAADRTRGLIKIDGSPVGTLTFGLKGDAAGGYVQTTGPVLARMLSQAGVPAGRIGASVAAVAAAAPIGAWFGQAIAAREAVGWVAGSALVALLPDRQGVWQASVLAPPAAVADHVIGLGELVSLPEADDTLPAPFGEFKVGWGRIWTTFKGNDLAPALRGTSDEARLAEPYRYAIAADAAVKARWPHNWATLKLDTALRREADALALAAELQALFGLRADGKPRRAWRVTLELTAERLALPLGSTVQFTYPPAGIDDRFVLLAEEPLRPRRDQVIWTLWG